MTTSSPRRDVVTPRTVVLLVGGMSCRHCVRQVTACLRDVPGVVVVEADMASCQVRLRGRFALTEVLSALAPSGHTADVLHEEEER